MGLKTGQAGINLIKQFEGCRLDAYKCPAGVWTIGYGHTAGVKSGDKISAAQAEAYLRADLERFEKQVEKYDRQYVWTQNQFDALVAFAYNIGSIDQLTGKGKRTKDEIADAILLYNKAGGKVLNGLVRRRQAERGLYITYGSGLARDNVKNNTSFTVKERSTLKYGSRGADVTYLQKCLAAKGYSVSAIDGVYGNKTLVAVKAFQKENGLKIDGIVGPKTWAKLSI